MLGSQRGGVVVVVHIRRYDARVGLRRKRADYIREGIVRQPRDTVVVGPARIHPVTRAVAASYASRCSAAITLVVPDRKEGTTRADRKTWHPLRLGRVGVTIQLEWGTEGHPAISGADIEDVAGIAGAGVARGIDVVNDMVIGGRFAPAHVSPVTGHGARIHTAEVAHRTAASADERGTGIGIGPGITAIGGAVDLVIPVAAAAGTATTSAVFVHAGEVHVARNQVAGDLHVANECSGDLSFVGPGIAVVSGIANEDIPAAREVAP